MMLLKLVILAGAAFATTEARVRKQSVMKKLKAFAKQQGERQLQSLVINTNACFSAPGVGVPDCSCHETCLTCGYSDEPHDSNDCIACVDGSVVVPVFSDGTGTCGGAGDGDGFEAAGCQSEYATLLSCYETHGGGEDVDEEDDGDGEDDDILVSCEAYEFYTAFICFDLLSSDTDDGACLDATRDAYVCLFERQVAEKGLDCDLEAACAGSSEFYATDAAVKTTALSGLAVGAGLAALLSVITDQVVDVSRPL